MARVDSPILNSVPSASAAQMLAYLARTNPTMSQEERTQIVSAYWNLGMAYSIDPVAAFAQACHETGCFRFGGQVGAAQHNPAGLGATNDGAAALKVLRQRFKAGTLTEFPTTAIEGRWEPC